MFKACYLDMFLLLKQRKNKKKDNEFVNAVFSYFIDISQSYLRYLIFLINRGFVVVLLAFKKKSKTIDFLLIKSIAHCSVYKGLRHYNSIVDLSNHLHWDILTDTCICLSFFAF